MFTKAANRNQIVEVLWICLPESMVKEVWSLCHQSDLGGHRGLEGSLNKFLKRFFMLSARQKLRFLNGGCDTCFTKERSMQFRTGEHVPCLTGYVREKLCIDLVSMLDTLRRKPIPAHGRRQLQQILSHVFNPKQGSAHCGQGIDISAFEHLQISYSQTMAKNLQTIYGENCSLHSRYSILQLCSKIRLLILQNTSI